MPNDIAQAFANSKNTLVVAAAGCGKTHLIADAVAHGQGRQLILTHTHAGVRALLDHMKRRGLSAERFRVSTIDGFALRYANSFPFLSHWNNLQPTDDQWRELRPAAARAFEHAAVRKVLSSSYTGVYVDEYQDCTTGQHELVRVVAGILPTRVLGDPMQSVFWKVNADDQVGWPTVESHFETVTELQTPHRWIRRNEELGEWLLDARRRLLAGDSIDLRNPTVSWQSGVEQPSQLAACLSSMKHRGHSVLAVRQWRHQCNHLARHLNGAFGSMETVECEDLLSWARKFELEQGPSRAATVIEFAKTCIARLPSTVTQWRNQIAAGRFPNPRRNDYVSLMALLRNIANNGDVVIIGDALKGIQHIAPRSFIARRELWREMFRSLEECGRLPDRSLSECAWHIRHRARHMGRHVDRRCLATTLLVKGLQFDHVLILNADELEDAENLYVAMTRGSRSLIILSKSPVLKRPKPHFA